MGPLLVAMIPSDYVKWVSPLIDVFCKLVAGITVTVRLAHQLIVLVSVMLRLILVQISSPLIDVGLFVAQFCTSETTKQGRYLLLP